MKKADLPQEITDDTPLRLAEAVQIAFPMGGMTVSGLRSEAEKGRLVIEMIAGKQFTTLAAIREMRKQCRVKARAQDCNSALPDMMAPALSLIRRHGESETDERISPRDALKAKLRLLSKG